MADSISVIIFDDSGLAYGFGGNCNVPLRNADNNCRYRSAGCSTCVSDLIAVRAAWGPCEACPEDFDSSGTVDVGDLLFVLAAWGPCP